MKPEESTYVSPISTSLLVRLSNLVFQKYFALEKGIDMNFAAYFANEQ